MKMLKLLVAVAIVMNLGEAQRPSYARRPGSNSKLLPRFRTNETATGLGAREGEEDSGSSSTTTLSPELQGTLEDHRFVHRVSQWPEDRQPFWFKNRYAISSMRHRDIDGGDVNRPSFDNQRPRPQFQSSFQGSGRSKERGAAQLAPNSGLYDDEFLNDPLFFYLRRPRSG